MDRSNRAGDLIRDHDVGLALDCDEADKAVDPPAADRGRGGHVFWFRVAVAAGLLHLLHDTVRRIAMASGRERCAELAASLWIDDVWRPSQPFCTFPRNSRMAFAWRYSLLREGLLRKVNHALTRSSGLAHPTFKRHAELRRDAEVGARVLAALPSLLFIAP